MNDNPPLYITIGLLFFSSMYMLVRYGLPMLLRWVARTETRLGRILNQQLLIAIPPRVALLAATTGVMLVGIIGLLIANSIFGLLVGLAVGSIGPAIYLRILERRRKVRLDRQLVDGIMTLASGVRAGLNLIQALELLASNSSGPIQQEIAQLLREYHMGLDLNQCMRNASDRIGSSHYRLLFTAIEMHRIRGGNAGESLDRIAESIREIQRLEGKLDALTSQGRAEAWMMALAPLLILAIYYFVDPKSVRMLFVEDLGRLLLLGATVLIVIAFLWIRRIMAVDI
jgi:tight adherence protein B